MRSLTLDEVVACPSLPSLPQVAVHVLELTRDPEVKLKTIASTVQNDQALAGKILRTVNSSFYGLSKPCPTISRALAYLGLSTVKSLVLGFSLIEVTGDDEDEFDFIGYWRRGLYAAAGARRLATLSPAIDPEEAFITSLMQDIGMLAINAVLGGEYGTLIASTGGHHRRLPAKEREAFGFTHAEAGAALGRKWRLPQAMIDVIEHHHSAEAPSIENPVLLQIARTANLAVDCIDDQREEQLNQLEREAARLPGSNTLEIKKLVAGVVEDGIELSRLLRVSIGARPDLSAVLAQAEDARVEQQLTMQSEFERLRHTNDELARETITDGLTAIGNRRHFDDTLAQRFEQARSFHSRLGVVLIDADEFKGVNDTHGHQAGDAVLVELAQRAQEQVGDRGMVCRYGGEEFAIILPGADRRAAAAMAEAVRRRIESVPFDLSAVENTPDGVTVSASFGVAVFESEVSALLNTPNRLVQAADKALYAAKQAGRNCVRVFSARPQVPTT